MKYHEREIAPGVRTVELVLETDEEQKPGYITSQMCNHKVVYEVDNTVPHQLTWRCPTCGKELTIKEEIK